MRRRDTRPPFEVMRGSSLSSSHAAGTGPQATGTSAGSPRLGDSITRLRQPLILRLPPGYAVLIGLGVVVLLIVAYSAGYSQGASKAREKQLQAMETNQGIAGRLDRSAPAAVPDPAGRGVPPLAGSNTAGVTANQGMSTLPAAGAGRIHDDSRQDPRKPGYQYYIIAHCSRDEAQRLVAFLHERGGVEAAAVLVHNKPLYVVFVMVPFTREQTTSREARELKQKITELGKVWASRTYRGPTNLSDAYLALYNPRPD